MLRLLSWTTRGKKARDQIIGWRNVSKRKQNCVPNVPSLKDHLKIFNCPQNCMALHFPLFTSITVILSFIFTIFSIVVSKSVGRGEKNVCRSKVELSLSKKRKIYYFARPSHTSSYISSFFFFLIVIYFNKLVHSFIIKYINYILIITKHFNPNFTSTSFTLWI